MSKHPILRRSRRARKLRTTGAPRRDEGMTLVELLISIALTGVLVTALSGAVVVIMNQQSTGNGRLNNARAENGAGLWIPGDLASAGQNVDTSPSINPCFGTCPVGADIGGSNAMMLSWSTLVAGGSGQSVTRLTQVSYRYVLVGNEYQLIRVQCDKTEGTVTCRTNVVLHNLDSPPDGIFTAGVTVPNWIIKVSTPPDPLAIDPTVTTLEGDAPAVAVKNAQRVVVTVNGGGKSAGAGGGTNQISLSAGGTNRTLIDSTSMQGAPSLIAARSLCGGSITLIIDRSGSIGSTDFAKIKTAVGQFVTMFVGTPVRLKLVPFDTVASTVGATAPTWTTTYNMLNTTESNALLTEVTNMTYPAGYTNWEDAMFRTFYNADGTVAQDLPGMVVFFTDGVPTNSRLNNSSSSIAAEPPAAQPGYSTTVNGQYQQQGFDRANLIAAAFRDTTRFIGVGVGPGISGNQTWISSIPGYHYDYTHSYHLAYSRYYHIEKGYHADTTVTRWYHMEKNTGSTSSPVWVDDASATTTSTLGTSNGQRRLRFTAPYRLSKTSLSASAKASQDMATTWTAPTTGSTNLTLFTAQDVAANPSTDGNDGWSAGRLYTSPYTYWEINTSATSSTALSSSSRAAFSAPYSFARSVNLTDAAIADPTTSWTTNAVPTVTNQSIYSAQNPGPPDTDSSDGWTGKSYTSPYSLSDPVTTSSTGYSSADASWTRSAKQYSVPYTAYDAAVTSTVTGAKILSRLVANSDTGVPATLVGGVYTNALTANMYISPDYTNFGLALQTIALSQCGGTLTLQTKVGSTSAADPFTYQKTALTDSAGKALVSDMTVITTTKQFSSGTFDLNISDGTFRTVEIQPLNLSDLSGYTSGTWSCKAGVTPRTFTLVSTASPIFSGIRVKVSANEAVSCVQTVTR